MTVEDCERLSRDLSPALDVEDPIDRAYHLEVSSPGIDRPLVRRSDFERWAGHLAKVELDAAARRPQALPGRLAGLDGDRVGLELDDGAGTRHRRSWLPLADIGEARLVLTDALVRETLRAARSGRPREAETNPTPTRRYGAVTDLNRNGRQTKWPSVQTGWNSCRSPTRSRARRRSTA